MSTLSIGVTGLTAASIGLSTASHNIANASTPGFNRQTIVQGTNFSVLTGSGFVGQGTHVETVKRIYSQFLSEQVLSAQANASEMSTYEQQISQIDNMLGDASSGLSTALSDFFAGTQQVAANPSSIPSRQSMLSSAQSLVARFQSLDQRISEIRNGINDQISGEVAQVTSYASQIADINQRILYAESSTQNQQPNDLLDQRDQLISQLNQVVRVSTVAQTDGSINVFFGNGQPLVVGTDAYSLSAVAATDDPARIVVAIKTPGGTSIQVPESQVTGGTLGGLISFRSGSLDEAQNALGRIAVALTQTFNDQHRLGQDLNGTLGGDFFSVAGPNIIANTANTGTGLPTATVVDANQLTTSDYRVAFDGTNYIVTRLSDNTTVSNTATLPVTVDGVTIGVGTWAPNANDSIQIQPTRAGAGSIAVMLSDVRNIAAAAPMRSAAALANTGTGAITAGTVDATTQPPLNANLQQPVTITFNNPPTTFNVTGTGTGNPTNVAYTAGASISYNGWTVQISGAPAAGDVFSVSSNTGGTADNRNAVLLAGLQTANTMIGSTASYLGAYTQIVSDIGTTTRQVKTIGQAQQSLVDQATAQMQSMSGVNLDEEAANLIRYQQAYQASAKVIEISSKVFDSILALG